MRASDSSENIHRAQRHRPCRSDELVRARRLGVFGGTFDPLHHAHLIVAAEAFEALDLDLLIFVPAADLPIRPVRSWPRPSSG
jgi:cytidyltransferase-like protein